MKTHNRILFHCLCCGNVVHAEPQDAVPTCCGKRMANAAAETVVEGGNDEPQYVAGPVEGGASRTTIRPVPR